MIASGGVYAACSFEQPRPGTSVVRISGELDACSVPAVEAEVAACLACSPARVVLDLGGLVFIDSTGIRMVLQVLRGGCGIPAVLVTPRGGPARRALEILGLTRAFPAVETLEAALCETPPPPKRPLGL